MSTLLDVSKSLHATKNAIVTQDFIKKSGLLQTMQWSKSSHGLYDKDVISGVADASFRKIGGGISSKSASARGIRHDLFPFAQYHTVDKAIIDGYDGGLKQYLKDKGPAFASGAGQYLAKQMFYGYEADAEGFKGVRQIALANDKYWKPSGSAADNTSSIYVVKWDLREFCGLYSKDQYKQSAFRIKIMNNGEYVIKDGQPVYEFYVETYLGLKSLTASNCAMIYNLKDTTNFKPTKALIDKAIRSIKGTYADTFIYMNSTVKGIADDNLKSTTHKAGDTEVGVPIQSISNIRIAVDDNIVDTESNSSVS